ncbi:ANK REP REGION domain-containing protein [Citrus sinensis]|uniref:ANK REP REGION domain-containing protein n=1 Tax=Citrus sinensis TaxID=2711 RepID=A0ACB8MJF6_CITSI|nr:ANK REP REGION domain-containing protein [Citrus sinensis]
MATGIDIDQLKKGLFKSAMKGKWNEVVENYGKDDRIHEARITRSGGTALHIAVSDGQEEIVEDLVRIIHEKQQLKVLKIGDERGSTPLHIAAGLGNVSMCKCIATADPRLIGERNHENETPFFLAARHGHKDAFLCLHYLCASVDDGYNYSRRKNGETILHYAISGYYFDLAFQIIHLYEKLVNFVNERGVSPLHLLATKPNAFRSGSHLGLCTGIIYHCISVDKLQEETSYDQHLFTTIKKQTNYPENYETCLNFIRLLKTMVIVCHQFFPPNYGTCFEFVKLVSKPMLVILGLGSTKIRKIRDEKQKHTWSVQILDELLRRTSLYEYDYVGGKPLRRPSSQVEEDETIPYAIVDGGDTDADLEGDQQPDTSLTDHNRETPILIAAKNGITEIVEKILKSFPVAILDMNSEKKNVMLLAVENRQRHVYQLLLKTAIIQETVFRKVDDQGNSALHLAATLGDHKPWLIPGAALQMQWELKWYEFVRDSMPFHFFVRYNDQNKSAKDVFTETHKKLVQAGGQWLTQTSEACTVMAALIATVAFTSSSNVPGGVNGETGDPNLKDQLAFNVFAFSSLVALSFSMTALVVFFAIKTSRFQEQDFRKDLPEKLLLGLTSLFVSIASMMISFWAGHFLVVRDKLKSAAFPVYAVTCLPVTLFAIARFPLYYYLIWAIFKKVPQRSYQSIPP